LKDTTAIFAESLKVKGGYMTFCNPFTEKGNWYKGNLHMHTKNSDGIYSPGEIIGLYKKKGYDFLCIADHHKITTVKKKPEGLLLIPGAEMGTQTHVLGINMKKAFDEKDMKPQEIIDEIVRQNALAIVSHPYWSSLTSADLFKLKGYIGFEIYNNICHNLKGKGYSTVHFDEVLQSGMQILGFSSDDTHSEKDLFGGFLMVKAKTLNRKAIMDALKRGCFYSSTGVLIKDLKIEGSTVSVSFSPSMTVDFIGYSHRGARVAGENKEIKKAVYKIKGTEKFLRIEITDKNNRKAWVNPVFL